MTKTAMKVGGKYKWKGRPELIYLGTRQYPGECWPWHQFKKIDDPREVWCEVSDDDLSRIEETPDSKENSIKVWAMIDALIRAESKRDKLHAEHQGKHMADDVHKQFTLLRDTIIPELRKQITGVLTGLVIGGDIDKEKS